MPKACDFWERRDMIVKERDTRCMGSLSPDSPYMIKTPLLNDTNILF